MIIYCFMLLYLIDFFIACFYVMLHILYFHLVSTSNMLYNCILWIGYFANKQLLIICGSFPALSCEFASVDVNDVLGTVSQSHIFFFMFRLYT